jgi:hypothetical protein
MVAAELAFPIIDLFKHVVRGAERSGCIPTGPSAVRVVAVVIQVSEVNPGARDGRVGSKGGGARA